MQASLTRALSAPQADRAELLARRARLAAALQAHALGSLGAILSRHYRVRGGGAAAALDAALTAQACAADARCDVDLVAPTAVRAAVAPPLHSFFLRRLLIE